METRLKRSVCTMQFVSYDSFKGIINQSVNLKGAVYNLLHRVGELLQAFDGNNDKNSIKIYPYQAQPLQSFSMGAGGGGVRDPYGKNQSYHQPIKTKNCRAQYSHKSMPDAKFDSCSFSSCSSPPPPPP